MPKKNDKKFYEIDGHKVPRVTSIIGSLKQGWAMPWAARCTAQYIEKTLISLVETRYEAEAEMMFSTNDIRNVCEQGRQNYRDISQEALDIGSAVHEAIEVYFKTGVESKDELIEKPFGAFLDWVELNNVTPIEVELTVNYGYEFAGTLDFIGIVNGKAFVIDFKSSKDFYIKESCLQLAAYRKAYDSKVHVRDLGTGEILATTPFNGAIVRLDKITGFPEFHDVTPLLDDYEEMFMALLAFHQLWTKAPQKRELKKRFKAIEGKE